jgi:hypothetical protein
MEAILGFRHGSGELLHLHTFGRAPAGAAHGALPNRP